MRARRETWSRDRSGRRGVGSVRSPTLSAEQAKPPIPGMVRQTEIRIAPETTGRLATIAVIPGQHVHKGDLLAVLDNPELTAAVGEAKAAAASAKAERDRVYSGVRAEEVAIATQAVQTARSQSSARPAAV